ncbi:hypothetical protein ACIQ6Y_15455 [Streptomyces sp. NPDC096205]|uniref:hypothetical protein n=1 Tax=Streptomyces sp. NPDC096205 TaxID=3366081 RepID=UPI003830416F
MPLATAVTDESEGPAPLFPQGGDALPWVLAGALLVLFAGVFFVGSEWRRFKSAISRSGADTRQSEIQEEAMAQALWEMRQEDAKRMEEWKSEKTAELYSQIMEQLDRGVITCPKCAGEGGSHRTGGDLR